MAFSLGSLFVDLRANTADFVEGMGKAAYVAKKLGSDVSESLESIGGVVGRLLEPLGEFGAVLGTTLERIGSTAGGAISSFGKMGGAIGAIAGVGAGAAAALAIVETGAIGLAIHTAESAAQLGELSAKTGVSTETLAGLGLIGKAVGADMATLAKGLELMNNSAVKASIAPTASATAYSRLGISVRDASGKVKDSGDLFLEVADKLSKLPQPEQGYFAKQIFGRGGAEMIPVINQGIDSIRAKMEEAKVLGLGDPQTIQAAQEFKETLALIGAEGQGAAMQLTKELLPALQYVAGAIADAFKTGGAQGLIHDLAQLTKGTIAVGDTFFTIFEQIGIILEGLGGTILAVFNAIGAAIESVFKAGIGDFSGAKDALKAGYAGLAQETSNFFNSSKKAWEDNAKFIHGVMDSQLPALRPQKQHTGEADLEPKADKSVESITKQIDALKAQANAELDLAATTSQSIAAQNLQKAAGEADTLISKLTAEANAKESAERQKLLGIIKQHIESIRALTAEKQVAKDAVAIDAELQKETLGYQRQIASLQALSQAYAQGGAAIATAGINQQLEADSQKVAQLSEEYDLLSKMQGVSAEALGKVKSALDTATAQLEQHRTQLETIRSLKYDEEINKQGDAIRGAIPLIDNLNRAYLQDEESIRRAQVQLQLYNWQLAHPGASQEQIQATTNQFERQSEQARDSQIAQEAGQYSLNRQYDDAITKLEKVREVIQSSGQSTLLIDARIFDEQNKLIKQWDDAALKVGTFSQKFKAVMNEVALQGKNAGAQIAGAFLSAIDGIETNLAKLITGQKTNFKSVFQGLAESVTKAEIQKGVGALAGHFGLNIPGLGPKVDGSTASQALWVRLATSTGLTVGPASVPFGSGNPLAGFGIGSDAGGGHGSFLGSFLSMFASFGGGLANGGDMSPGSWYVAGERGPEIVTGPGTVIPNHALGGRTTNITHNHNYPSAASRDLFGRTQKQNQARQMRNMRLAYS